MLTAGGLRSAVQLRSVLRSLSCVHNRVQRFPRGTRSSSWTRWIAPVLAALVVAGCGAHQFPARQDYLTGEGIGANVFGQPVATVLDRLALGLGRPDLNEGPRQHKKLTAGVLPLHCGFAQVMWVYEPKVDNETFTELLLAYFRRSRFVGYAYQATGGGPSVLRTDKGLGVGDSLARARDIYGPSLRLTKVRTPDGPIEQWRTQTATGAISGSTLQQIPAAPTLKRTVTTIRAGTIPGVLCGLPGQR